MEKSYRLLIVDDQPRARQSLKALLEISFPQIEMSEASDGKEALRYVEAHLPDIIIMDARMPELDGIEATRFIKLKYPHMKVIVLSMYEEYQTAALAAGADTFITKAESPDTLLAAITALMITFSF